MMPKKDGFTLAQDVRAANAEIPIIFLTAKTLKEDILEAGRFRRRGERLRRLLLLRGGSVCQL